MKKTLFCATFATASALVFATPSVKASVWEHGSNKWSLEAEKKFGEWIARTSPQVFVTPGSKYNGIATDCADAAYTLRVIFAYENKLPVKFQNADRLSNLSPEFDSVSDEWERVKKFIRRVNYDTSTNSIPNDTYPVAINRNSFRPGLMFVHASSGANVPITYRAGHVYYLQNISSNGQIKYISSTVPVAVRALANRIGIDFAPQEMNSGYRAWKWPDSDERPFYSEEQFKIGGWRAKAYGDNQLWANWQEAVQSRIRTRRISASEMYLAASTNLKSILEIRASSVISGWNFYRGHYGSGQCMSASDYDDHSTPTRDVKIQGELYEFQHAAKLAVQSDLDFMKRSMWDNEEARLERVLANFQIEVLPGRRMNYSQLYRIFMTEKVLEISEPEHSPEVRWGFQDQKNVGGWVCPARKKQYKGGDRA